MLQISKGLEYLHSHGIVYKDLKSDNILTMSLDIRTPVNLKLSDYGNIPIHVCIYKKLIF